MRPIGLVAAAAAGLIAPLAIAMPALAGTESPVLSGMTKIVDGGGGPDNGPDNGDHNGDNGPDNGPNNGDHGPGNGDNGPGDGDSYVHVSSAQNSRGDTQIIVEADNFSPLSDNLSVSSASLENACEGRVSFDSGSTDRYGIALLNAHASECVPGDYRITVADPNTPGDSASAEVTIY